MCNNVYKLLLVTLEILKDILYKPGTVMVLCNNMFTLTALLWVRMTVSILSWQAVKSQLFLLSPLDIVASRISKLCKEFGTFDTPLANTGDLWNGIL